MASKKDIQPEDKPVSAEPVVQAVEPEVKPVDPEIKSVEPVVEPKAQKSFIAKALPWVIVAVVFFVGGIALSYFTFYQQKVEQLKSVQTELDTANQSLADANARLTTLDAELTTAKNNLTTAQTDIDELNAEIVDNWQSSVIYKFQSDVNVARIALLGLDPASSRQALNFVKQDLSALQDTSIDPDAIAGFSDKINEALINLESDPQKSADAMETLYSNLLLLISNL